MLILRLIRKRVFINCWDWAGVGYVPINTRVEILFDLVREQAKPLLRVASLTGRVPRRKESKQK
jgi:hypothetical protein